MFLPALIKVKHANSSVHYKGLKAIYITFLSDVLSFKVSPEFKFLK